MAQYSRRHPENADGPWFVDDSCFNCDASRQCAPGLLAERGDQSIFIRQPSTPEEVLAATRAMLICPTASIGVVGAKPDTEGAFPLEVAEGLYLCGYASPKAYGANAWFVQRAAGNLLVDGPRFLTKLVRFFEERGGLSDILLTHRDDVGEAERYAAHFGARLWIHEEDRSAAPSATNLLQGEESTWLAPDLQVLPVPGHTQGSVMFLLQERFLFSGDSLYWSRTLEDLSAFRRQCWYSWPRQAESLARLESVRCEWLLPGHGSRRRLAENDMRVRIPRLVERMRREDPLLIPSGNAQGSAVW
jgi:glyoxylase-like metal-dependent hydrolase (beta-lactamase superfamily II)